MGVRVCHACFPFQFADHEDYDPQTVRLGSRYSHVQEVQERLNFLRLVSRCEDAVLAEDTDRKASSVRCVAEVSFLGGRSPRHVVSPHVAIIARTFPWLLVC